VCHPSDLGSASRLATELPSLSDGNECIRGSVKVAICLPGLEDQRIFEVEDCVAFGPCGTPELVWAISHTQNEQTPTGYICPCGPIVCDGGTSNALLSEPRREPSRHRTLAGRAHCVAIVEACKPPGTSSDVSVTRVPIWLGRRGCIGGCTILNGGRHAGPSRSPVEAQ